MNRYIIVSKNDLYHHGVKGMRWGVRKDRERGLRNRSNNKQNASKRKGLSKRQKIALGIAGVAAIGGVTVWAIKTGKFNSVINSGRKAISHNMKIENSAKSIIGHASSKAKEIKPINECCNLNSFASTASNDNLHISIKPEASHIYEKSGYNNVTTLLNSVLKKPNERIFDTIPPDRFTDKDKMSSVILNRIAKNTEGAKGQITSDLIGGGGHAFDWRVEGGKVLFSDTHANVNGIYKPVEDASRYFSLINGKNGKITRLDGLTENDFTDDALKIFNIKKK